MNCKTKKSFRHEEAFEYFMTPSNLKGGATNIVKSCHLCGKKKSGMRGIALVHSIKIKNARTQNPKVTQCRGPSYLLYLCPSCHNNVWSMFFELWDAVANGDVKPLLDGSYGRVIELARKRYQDYRKKQITKRKERN